MKKYFVEGGRKLSGSVTIESAKNSVLALIAASILTEEQVVIKNCPKILDVLNMVEILSYLGVCVGFTSNELIINAKKRKGFCVPEELSSKLRTSIYFLGALSTVEGKAKIFMPGGCNIGDRPIDLHISSLKSLGVIVKSREDGLWCERVSNKGGTYIFSLPSVGATINALLASVKCNGKTILYNCAKEPEIKDLACFLNSMGAKINGAGSSRIEIIGVKELRGTEYTPIPDRIETGTFLLAGAITGGKIQIKNANIENINILLHKISNNSCKLSVKNDIINADFGQTKKGFNIETGPFPKFPTDLQPPVVAYLSICEGCFRVKEHMFERRFFYTEELVKMGADIEINGSQAIVKGVKGLVGAEVEAKDLRGGAALVLAGLGASGVTVIEGAEFIERGYYNLPDKLNKLGAKVTCVNDN